MMRDEFLVNPFQKRGCVRYWFSAREWESAGAPSFVDLAARSGMACLSLADWRAG